MSDNRILHITEKDKADIVGLYLSGDRSSAIAKKYKIDRGTVLSIVEKSGHKTKEQKLASGRNPSTAHLEPSILETHKNNMLSQSQVAKELGVSQSVVSRVLRKYGLEPNKYKAPRGSESHGWKGGVIKASGYLAELSDEYPSMKNSMGYILQHRLVMARELGRALYKWESVHHIDGDRTNNKLSNLQLRIGNHGKHSAYKCGDCGSYKIIPTKID